MEAFFQANEAECPPHLKAALDEIAGLKDQLQSRNAEVSTLQAELREASVLKTQEERDLVEFRSLREKESELQEARLKLAQMESQLEELQSTNKVLLSRAAQSEAALGEKSRKILDFVHKAEGHAEQCRILSNENNTLRLQLGKDSDFDKVVCAPEDPLAFKSAAGQLAEPLQREERRFQEELAVCQFRFPGLLSGTDNCRAWCGAQLLRQSTLYKSYLHLLQDTRKGFPDGMKFEFVSKTKEVDAAWSQREEEMREQDSLFQEHEKEHTKKWELKRLELVAERDSKIKQLLEQTERSQSKAERQLLMQQAKLFGGRMDTQIERAWEEQRKERDARWAVHNKAKQESRQRFKNESLSVQQQVEGVASASERFNDLAEARLATIEDAWLRNLEKESAVSSSVLKGGDLGECLQAAGLDKPRVPPKGLQHAGVSDVAESVEEIVKRRVADRRRLCKDLEGQSLQQLRTCVEKFVQKEGAQTRKAGICAAEDEETVPEYTQAATIRSLLQARQHRVVADTIKRQFNDFLLVLRIATLGAVRLLPETQGSALKIRGARLDLPPAPPELLALEALQKTGKASAGSAAVATTPLSPANEDPKCGDVGGHALVSIADAPTSSPAGSDCQTGIGAVVLSDATVAADAQEQQLEERVLYDSLMRRLLERMLTPLHQQHREELLTLKRDQAREVRQVLQHLCQREASVVDAATRADLEEYRSQVKAKLLSDCEYHICEERKQLTEQVDAELEMHISQYKRQVLEEEISALRERRKWLTERLVVMQSQGVLAPGDKAVLSQLRSELRACELRFERREQELLAYGGNADAAPTEPVPKTSVRADGVKSVGPASSVGQSEQTSADADVPATPQRLASKKSLTFAPVPPTVQPPQSRRPTSRTASPNPSGRQSHQQQTSAFPIGRASGVAREATTLHFPMPPSPALAAVTVPLPAAPMPRHTASVSSMNSPSGCRETPKWGGMQAPALSRCEEQAHRIGACTSQTQLQPQPPQMISSEARAPHRQADKQPPAPPTSARVRTQPGSPSFGADGAAGFGRTERITESSVRADPSESPLKCGGAPLYEWPFETSALGTENRGCRSLSAPVTRAAPKSGLPEMLPPLRNSVASAGRPLSAERRILHDATDPLGGVGAHSAGLSLGMPAGLKSARGVPSGAGGGGGGAPPWLPRMSTPRGRAVA
eukprot:TRINITY_DN18240_c0_g1_i1.p1 TRINITY_DN18240_c0_g1~~TRINITY_DN18240_c0_g1_i1.p1  ORF type:complete len:1386 (-),score=285.32 TRINITY_DN18240_c0_g1_i1:93-3647(-)